MPNKQATIDMTLSEIDLLPDNKWITIEGDDALDADINTDQFKALAEDYDRLKDENTVLRAALATSNDPGDNGCQINKPK